MKHFASVVIYNKTKSVYREDFEFTPISVSEFSYKKHMGKLFIHPGDELSIDTEMYAWQWCEAENEEEERQLIENGDMVSFQIGGIKKNYIVNKN